ncbi:MAG: pantoate--beta-alanine ligase [Chloroflexota bacterium]
MTRVLHSRAELRAAMAGVARPVGLVTTMGWLHDGHRALLRRARQENATTVVTIFVNPRQFGDDSDFQRYPRDVDADFAICEAEGVDIVWQPGVEDVYPPGFDTTVGVGAVAAPLEGAARPGHFDGVATVVATLFSLVGAEQAYFGQKDAQQIMVIARMATDLGLPTRVITCPTVREADGLALSSRNTHLTPDERRAAPILHRALTVALGAWRRGERSGEVLRKLMMESLAKEPLAQVEYVSCADATTLTELGPIEETALLSVAVVFGSTRLIDNVTLGMED